MTWRDMDKFDLEQRVEDIFQHLNKMASFDEMTEWYVEEGLLVILYRYSAMNNPFEEHLEVPAECLSREDWKEFHAQWVAEAERQRKAQKQQEDIKWAKRILREAEKEMTS